MDEVFNSMSGKDKGALYLSLVKGLVAFVDGTAQDNSGLDNSDCKEIFDEIQNTIFSLRKNWKCI